jgi:dTMP kinase
MRGKLITLEGVDGAGKSSHVEFVADTLRARGRKVLVTREPGGSPLAEMLRTIVLEQAMDAVAETLLMFAARADHVARAVRPALDAGTWVVCDRFTDASVAYQGAGKGVPAQLIRQLADAAHPGLSPDLTLLFDCPWEVAQERLARGARKKDRFEREGQDYFERVRSCYLELARNEPSRVRTIDANQRLDTIQVKLKEVLSGI